MIVAAPGGGLLRIVTQPDHAHFAARLLSLFRVSELAGHPRRSELLAAIRRHDDGWQGPDAAPRVNRETGRPLGFTEIPADLRQQIWRDGSRRHVAAHPYSALLATRHARALSAVHRGEADWEAFLAELDEREAELLERCGLAEAELAADYRWLDLVDLLSLVACWARPQAVERAGTTAVWAAGELRLAPFPLAGSTTLALSCREIPDRPYGGDGDLALELATSRWHDLPVRVVPADGAV